jgi:hypothetical protein
MNILGCSYEHFSFRDKLSDYSLNPEKKEFDNNKNTDLLWTFPPFLKGGRGDFVQISQ